MAVAGWCCQPPLQTKAAQNKSTLLHGVSLPSTQRVIPCSHTKGWRDSLDTHKIELLSSPLTALLHNPLYKHWWQICGNQPQTLAWNWYKSRYLLVLTDTSTRKSTSAWTQALGPDGHSRNKSEWLLWARVKPSHSTGPHFNQLGQSWHSAGKLTLLSVPCSCMPAFPSWAESLWAPTPQWQRQPGQGAELHSTNSASAAGHRPQEVNAAPCSVSRADGSVMY